MGLTRLSLFGISKILAIILVFSLSIFLPPPLKASASELSPPAISGNWGSLNILAADRTVWTLDKQGKTVQISGLTGIVAVSAGTTHSLALKSDGTVIAWGRNGEGQLGNGKLPGQYEEGVSHDPAPVIGLDNVKAVAAGDGYSIALKNDGTVWVWGKNCNLGNDISVNNPTPVQAVGLTNIISISADRFPIAVQNNGVIWTLGWDPYNHIGRYLNMPVVDPYLGSVLSVSYSSYSHLLALHTDGTVWAVGKNSQGQLGDGTNIDRSQPVQVKGLNGVSQIITGSSFSVALKTDGTVWAWGENNTVLPYLGDGTTSSINYPVQVQGLTGIKSLASQFGTTYALKDDGTIWAWGDLRGYEGITTNPLVPVKTSIDTNPSPPHVVDIQFPEPSRRPIFDVGVGIGFTVVMNEDIDRSSINLNNITAYDEDGKPIAINLWIDNFSTHNFWIGFNTALIPGYTYTVKIGNVVDAAGFAMTDTFTYQFHPILPIPQYTSWALMSAGGLHSLLGGDLMQPMAAGDNHYGQLGDGTRISRSVLVPIKALPKDIRQFSAGSYHSLALSNDGTVWAWGNNQYGQIGNGMTDDALIPVQLSLTSIVAVAAGDHHSMALKEDGTVWTWGGIDLGQLGDGTLQRTAVPIQVPGLRGVVAIAAGGSHSLALKSDGTVWAWGSNGAGQLGDGTNEQRLNPVQVLNLDNVTKISAGWKHSLALQKNGTVWAWGDNSQGQLGDGGTEDSSSTPVQVKDLSNVVDIDAGYNFNLASSRNGSYNLYTWGDNSFGQMGDSFNQKSMEVSPVKIWNVSPQNFSAGGAHSMVDNGGVFTWGYNEMGQLGNGLTINVEKPTEIELNNQLFYRLAGWDATETASQISQVGWSYGSNAAILVWQGGYSDALAGTTLAKAVNAPILLTDSKTLSAETAFELEQLSPSTIYILGGNAVISKSIEDQLKQQYGSVIRIGGYDKYETAAEIAGFLSDKNYLTPGKAIIAYGDNFQDALAVSSLAAYQKLPILLTQTHNIPASTKAALDKLAVNQTIIVGGKAVVGEDVANQLPRVTRYWGMDGYETAIQIAKGMGADPTTIFMATGENFPDALAGSALAAKSNSPVILVNKSLPQSVSNYFVENKQTIKEVFALGGEAVIPDLVLQDSYTAIHPE